MAHTYEEFTLHACFTLHVHVFRMVELSARLSPVRSSVTRMELSYGSLKLASFYWSERIRFRKRLRVGEKSFRCPSASTSFKKRAVHDAKKPYRPRRRGLVIGHLVGLAGMLRPGTAVCKALAEDCTIRRPAIRHPIADQQVRPLRLSEKAAAIITDHN